MVMIARVLTLTPVVAATDCIDFKQAEQDFSFHDPIKCDAKATVSAGVAVLMFFRRALVVAPLFMLAWVLLLPSVCQAEEVRGAQAYLDKALRLYDELDYEQALEQLALGRSVSMGVGDDIDLSLCEGLILAELGRSEASDAALTAALLLQPTAKLPRHTPPKVLRRFEELRKQAEQQLALKSLPQAPPFSPPQLRPRVIVDSVVHKEWTNDYGTRPRKSSEESALRRFFWVPMTVGGALLAGGGVGYLFAREELSRLKGSGSEFDTYGDVQRASSQGQKYQRISVGLAGAGIAALGVAGGLYLLGRPTKPQQVAVGLGSDGASAYVFGSLP
jgi:tetratricopeptide (TPR) repeat protein